MYKLTKQSLSVQKKSHSFLFVMALNFKTGSGSNFFVENRVIIAIKSIEPLAPLHFKKSHTYLKLSRIKNGVLVNFNYKLLKEGFYRRLNNFAG